MTKDDERYRIFRSAHEGDTEPLALLLESGREITPEIRELLVKILRDTLKRPSHRQQTLKAQNRWVAIAKRFHELENEGMDFKPAVHDVAREFGCHVKDSEKCTAKRTSVARDYET